LAIPPLSCENSVGSAKGDASDTGDVRVGSPSLQSPLDDALSQVVIGRFRHGVGRAVDAHLSPRLSLLACFRFIRYRFRRVGPSDFFSKMTTLMQSTVNSVLEVT
jgi:hypothetical protein